MQTSLGVTGTKAKEESDVSFLPRNGFSDFIQKARCRLTERRKQQHGLEPNKNSTTRFVAGSVTERVQCRRARPGNCAGRPAVRLHSRPTNQGKLGRRRQPPAQCVLDAQRLRGRGAAGDERAADDFFVHRSGVSPAMSRSGALHIVRMFTMAWDSAYPGFDFI